MADSLKSRPASFKRMLGARLFRASPRRSVGLMHQDPEPRINIAGRRQPKVNTLPETPEVLDAVKARVRDPALEP